MKYQNLASLALALSASTSVSAIPLRAEGGSCPAGYSPSVYYITVTASASAEPTSTTTSIVEPTTSSEVEILTSTMETTSSFTSSVTDLSTVGAIETIPAAIVKASASTSTESAAPAATSATEEPVTEPTTQVAVAQPSTTTTAAAEEKTTSTSSSSQTSTKTSSAKSSAATSGTATFYGGNLSGGTCSFSDYTLPSGITGVAYSGSAWDSAAECGACVEVTGPDGNTVKAMIVDQCPECSATHLDLFEGAFTTLASASEGEINISYSIVPCSISTPLTLRNKSGTSAYWFSMQVLNANEAVKSLEVSTDGGETWQGTTRSEYNFFENQSGFGTEKVDVRVTGVGGKSVTVKNVSVESGSSVEADGNC